jgi:RNA recognition motif-containing protein
MPVATCSFDKQKNTQHPRKEVTQTSTVVLRQLPEQYARSHVRKLLNAKGFSHQYDFIYVPYDFKTSKTLRYAIVNFTSIAFAKKAKEQLDGAAVDDAILDMQFSKSHAGLESLVERYRDSPVMNDCAVPQSHKPLLLENGKAVPFPWPSV